MIRIQLSLYLVFTACVAFGMTQQIHSGARTITLSEAINQALDKHPALRIQQSTIQQALGKKRTAAILPNPMVTFYREDLALKGQAVGETTIYAGLPLNFLWSRWPQISAADARVQAEQLVLEDKRRMIKFEVQKAFAETHFAIESYGAWQKAVDVFRQAAKAGRVRFTDGDMAGYEHQRITVEYLRYRKAQTVAKVRVNTSRRQLAFLINPDQGDTLIQTSSVFPTPTRDVSLEQLLAQSMKNRPDLQAAHAMVQSRRASLNATKMGRLPDVSVAAGYKRQVDDSKGAVVQISLGVPLFDRNQGNIQSAGAALIEEELVAELLEKRVAMEVRQAYESYQLYRQQVAEFQNEGIEPERLLEVAQFSYSEGEMSLLEVLDGVRAFSESFQTRSDLLLKYQLSLFELEKATAMPLTGF